MSFPPGTEMFQFPGFASSCLCIQHEITCSINFGRSYDQSKFIEEIGFPHSEICGSKVAHTSPQLIAACHVLHRLCMPRHPPNALTSRLKTRTTNDTTVKTTALALTMQASNDFCFWRHHTPKEEEGVGARYRSHRLVCPTRPTHGIVQKNPFTMSKIYTAQMAGKWFPHPGCLVVGGAYRDRTDDLKLAKLALSQLS